MLHESNTDFFFFGILIVSEFLESKKVLIYLFILHRYSSI